MATPSSTRSVTRSQTLSTLQNSATNHLLSSNMSLFSSASEDSERSQSKSIQRNGGKPNQDRPAMFDITNDSPIVGVAMQTPSSRGVMRKSRIKSTPGSGEALLRHQVKTLLQKVDEEADLTKISMESRPFIHLVTSPMGLLAPTPANTPQVLHFSSDTSLSLEKEVKIVITSPVVAGPSQMAEGNMFDEKEETPRITRSLLLDFSDKSEEVWESSDCSSVVTQIPEDDDSSSVWSMQVNASAKDYEDDDDEEEAYSYSVEEEEELCEGMRKMNVAVEFAGKHTRFVYDSEDEDIVEAKE